MSKQRRAKPRDRDEQKFLAAYDATQFPRPSVTVDVALVTATEGRLQTLLIRRDEHPAKHKWTLPGGFVQMQESLDDAAARILATKAGLTGIFLEQLYTFGAVDRDPRTRVITVAYYALVNAAKLLSLDSDEPNSTVATIQVPWKGERGGPIKALDDQHDAMPLAFDHADILGLVVKRLRGKLNYAPIGFELLPGRFTLRQLQTVHETILDRTLNKDSFRRRMLASRLVIPTGKREADVEHRPAELYRFKRSSNKAR